MWENVAPNHDQNGAYLLKIGQFEVQSERPTKDEGRQIREANHPSRDGLRGRPIETRNKIANDISKGLIKLYGDNVHATADNVVLVVENTEFRKWQQRAANLKSLDIWEFYQPYTIRCVNGVCDREKG